MMITVKMSPSQNVPEMVKTSPNWSKRPQKLVKRPQGKKCWSKRPQNDFLFYILCNFSHNLGCLDETVLDKVFLSRFHSVISVKIALRMQFSDNPSIHDPSNITLLYIH